MKRLISSSTNETRLPITELTEDELSALPDNVLCWTRRSGGNYGYVYKIVSKKKMIEDPDKCFLEDDYWGYAHGRDVYLASKDDVREYEKEQIEKIKETTNKWMKYAL